MQSLDFTTLKPANYNRKSSETEDRQILSIISQKEEAFKLSEFYNLPPFVEVFEESKSAKTEFKRPEFSKMMNMLQRGRIDSIVCWKLDRLARNMTEGGKLMDMLSSGVIRAIITHDKVYYPWDNVIVMSVEFSQGKQYIKDLSVNVKRGLAKKASMGYPSGLAITGFCNDKTSEKGERKWIVDPERFPIVKEVFRLYLTGNWSVNKLAEYVRENLKLTTKKHKRIGGALLTIQRFHDMLKNPIYAGFFYHDEKRYELNQSLPRIISESEHIKIKRMIEGKGISKRQTHQLAYTGYIKSPEGDFIGQDVKHQLICDCKHKFSYRNTESCPKCHLLVRKLKNPQYRTYNLYYNVKRRKSGQKTRFLNERLVEGFLMEYFNKNLKFSDEFALWCKKYIEESKINLESRNVDQISILKQNREKLELKKSKIRQLLIEDHISPADYKAEMNQIDLEIGKITTQTKGDFDWTVEAQKLVDLSLSLENEIRSDDVLAKREFLSQLGSNLIWNEKNLCIINTKPVQALIDGLNLVRSQTPKFEPNNIVDTSMYNPVFRDAYPSLRKRRDSNPRCRFRHTSFPGTPIQPLSHSS